jgi:hypothetical protein
MMHNLKITDDINLQTSFNMKATAHLQAHLQFAQAQAQTKTCQRVWLL